MVEQMSGDLKFGGSYEAIASSRRKLWGKKKEKISDYVVKNFSVSDTTVRISKSVLSLSSFLRVASKVVELREQLV